MIRNTFQMNPENIISAYSDNAAVIEGPVVSRLFANPLSRKYETTVERTHVLIKVETHNHPTSCIDKIGLD